MKKYAAIVTESWSKSSEEVTDSFAQLFEAIGCTVFIINIKDKDWKVKGTNELVDKNDFSIKKQGAKINFDFVFTYAEGLKTKGAFQGYLSLLDIPCFPLSPITASICGNKFFCKNYIKHLNVLMPAGIKIKEYSSDLVNRFVKEYSFPLIVKPNIGTDSYLVSKVYDKIELEKKVKAILKKKKEVLIEEFISGREITCGVIVQNGIVIPTPVTEVKYTRPFYDYTSKLQRENIKQTPALFSESLTVECQELTKRIAKAIEIEGYARVDYKMRNGAFYFLEINCTPGLSTRSSFPLKLKEMQIDAKLFMLDIMKETEVKSSSKSFL